MKDSGYTLLYAALMGSVCAALLAGVGRFTAPYRKANAEAEEKRNVLQVLAVPVAPNVSSKELIAAFHQNVRQKRWGQLEVYVVRTGSGGSSVEAAAVPFSGQGLWGPIKGFLSLEGDMRTIRGVTFHEQEETPGLGGEIGSDWFREQFRGKSIESWRGKPGIRICAGGSKEPNGVDAISGATMTCNKVEAMLNEVIVQIVKERANDG